MECTILVTNELKNQGFKVRLIGQAIEVSLYSRKVNKMEVWYALGQTFEGIEFNLDSMSNGILVTV